MPHNLQNGHIFNKTYVYPKYVYFWILQIFERKRQNNDIEINFKLWKVELSGSNNNEMF